MSDRDDERGRCRQCGAPAGQRLAWSALCPACLFALALERADDGSGDEPAVTYQVLTVLAGDETRTTYLSEQWPTRRLVTVEVVRADAVGGLTPARFDARVESLERLVHPGIARVLEGRLTAAGDYCVIAQYVPGPPIDCYLRGHEVAPSGRLLLFSALCRALEHAHRHGVVHGRLTASLVSITGAGDAVKPVITGFSACSENATVVDDLEALRSMADAIAAPLDPSAFRSVTAVREALDRLLEPA